MKNRLKNLILGYAKHGEGLRALELLSRMIDQGIHPDTQSYVTVLEAFNDMRIKQGSNTELVMTARNVHAQLSAAGLESDPSAASFIKDLYFSLGHLEEVRNVSIKSSQNNVDSWNSIITGCVANRHFEPDLQLVSRMREEQGLKPDVQTFISIARDYSFMAGKEEGKPVDGRVVKLASLEKVRALHVEVSKSEYEHELLVANTLIDLYSRCGSMQDARRVFERMSERNIVSWSRMIVGYAQNGQGDLGLELYRRMRDRELQLDAPSYVAVLKAWKSQLRHRDKSQVLKEVKAIHSRAAGDGFELDMYVAGTLVDLYSKCGCMHEAGQLFERTVKRDVPLWNLLILGYVESKLSEQALKVFHRMQAEGFRPNGRTYVGALGACSALMEDKTSRKVSLQRGRTIHRQLAEEGYETERYVASCLVDLYARGGCMVKAREVFDKVNHDVVLWNNMMSGYSDNGQGSQALQLYVCMQEQGLVPNSRTYLAVIHACSTLERDSEVNVDSGRYVHSEVVRVGEVEDEVEGVFLASGLLDMYSKTGSMTQAQQVFDTMKQQDVVSWTSMVHGYSQAGEGQLAMNMLRQMQEEGVRPNNRTLVGALKALQVDEKTEEETLRMVSRLGIRRPEDVYVGNSLLDLYGKLGRVKLAEEVFNEYISKVRSSVSWNSMINACIQCGESTSGLTYFSRMHNEGFTPNDVTFVTVLKACGSLTALETGRRIHEHISEAGYLSTVTVTNSLVSFYGRCGSMSEAHKVFDRAARKDLVTWSSLIGGYSFQGDGEKVLELFERMVNERVVPDGVCFLHVLNACSHTGLVERGKEYFRVMWSDYGVDPGIDHWTCMVDLLGRANQVEEAVGMVREMGLVKVGSMMLETILGACSRWKNGEGAKEAFESMLMAEGGHYILVANSNL